MKEKYVSKTIILNKWLYSAIRDLLLDRAIHFLSGGVAALSKDRLIDTSK